MMDRFFGAIYTTYLNGMSKFGHTSEGAQKKRLDTKGGRISDSKSLETLDQEATEYGNAYRGIGVMVAFLGALIILSAVTPVALNLHGSLSLAFGITEVISMLLVIFLIRHSKKSQLDKKWRETRREAEKKRYENLFQQLMRTKESPTNSETEKLRTETLSHLTGENGQISYNERKAKAYHGIETVSNNLARLGFVLALAGAIGHFWFHASWLLLLTIFVPALVGAFHGLNSFLKLDDLKDDHEKMAGQLSDLKSKMESLEPVADNSKLVQELAKTVHQTLVERDERWIEMAKRQNLQA